MKWSAVLFVLLIAAYPILANVFLASDLIQYAFAGTDTVTMHYRRAWSFWPGRVHVEDARVTMQDRNVQFVLTLPAVDVDIDLFALRHQVFHATRVRGEGVVFRFRHRIEQESKNAAFVGALPPIGEYDDPPLREAGPPAAPLDDAHYNLWTVHIEDVDVRVSELWAQMFRYQGDAHVVGAFRLRPAKRLWVGPAVLEIDSGTLVTGAHDVLYGMKGQLDVTVDDFDVEPVHGMEPFRFIDARLRLSSQVANLNAIGFVADLPFQVADGSGAIDVDAHADHAVFTRDSRAAFMTDHLAVNTAKFPLRFDGELNLGANGRSSAEGAHVRAFVPRGTLHIGASRHGAPTLHNVEASLDTTSLDIMRDWDVENRQTRFGEIRVADLRWVNDLPFLPRRDWKIEAGSAHIGGSAKLDAKDAIEGFIEGAVDDARVLAGEAKLQATTDLRVEGHGAPGQGAKLKGKWLAGNLEVVTSTASATLTRATIDTDLDVSPKGELTGQMSAESSDWASNIGDSRVGGSSLRAEAKFASSSVTARADMDNFRTSFLSACPWAEADKASVVAYLDAPADRAPRATLQADLDGFAVQWGRFQTRIDHTTLRGHYNDAKIGATLYAKGLDMKNEGGAPRGWQGQIGSALFTADLALDADHVVGPAKLTVHDAAGQIGKTSLSGDISANLAVSAPSSSRRTADLTGTVDIRKIALKAGEKEIRDWWANLQLDKFKVDIRSDLDLSGKVKAQFRDGLPALYILASSDEIPGWVPSVLPLNDIKLDLGIERYCRWTDVQIDDARGGPLAAEGRVQIAPGDTRGALLLRLAALKPVAMGLNFVEDYSHAAPLAGHGWLEEHLVPLTSAATEKHDERCIPQPPTCQ